MNKSTYEPETLEEDVAAIMGIKYFEEDSDKNKE